jgi:hypothetical protein
MNTETMKFARRQAGYRIRSAILDLVSYARQHKAMYGSVIGEDYVLGDYWRDSMRGLHGLLNGELGREDGGTLSGMICDAFVANGFKDDGEDLD